MKKIVIVIHPSKEPRTIDTLTFPPHEDYVMVIKSPPGWEPQITHRAPTEEILEEMHKAAKVLNMQKNAH